MRLTDAFLCSTPPHQCCRLFPLLSSCITHLSETHPEHALLVRTDGLVGLQNLPTAIKLSYLPDPLSARVWVCDDCRRLFSTRAAASTHLMHAREHRAWATMTLREEGERGCNRCIDAMERGMMMKARVEVHNYYFGRAPGREVEFNPLPAALPPPQFRVQVGPPFPPRSLLISVTADTILELAAQLALAWGPADNQPPWMDLLEAGMRVKFDHRDGTAGNLVVDSDRVVKKVKEVMKYGVTRVGRA